MRIIFTAAFLAFTAFQLLAQNQPGVRLSQYLEQAKASQTARNVALFSRTAGLSYDASLFSASKPPEGFSVDQNALFSIEQDQPGLLTFAIPAADGALETELVPLDLFAPGFKLLLGTASGTVEAPINQGVFYQGIIKGKPSSLVSIAIVDGELSGFVSDETGNRVLSRLKNSGNYLFYRDNTLAEKRTFVCSAETNAANPLPGATTGETLDCRGVGIYLEADYQLYVDNGSSVTNATNYVTRLFSQVATVYSRENIIIRIAGIKVWTASDPYAGATSTRNALDLFGNYLNRNPPAVTRYALSHLLSARSLGGGIAWLDVLCHSTLKYGVSANLGPSFPDFPNYSWEVMVVAHELGHNFGSPHTQSCSWPGGAIDNCYTTEGGCSPGPAPTNGGTVMSYCHLTGYGINLSNGFGLLPGNLIRSRTAAASCVAQNNNPPSGLTVSNSQATSITLSWQSTSGSLSFTVQYKLSTAASWNTVSGITTRQYNLTGLQPNTQYTWRVTGECDSGYSQEATFTSGQAVYCIPAYTYDGCYYGIGINQVVLNGTTLSNNTGCPSPYFTYYDAPVGTVSKTSSNTFTVGLSGNYYSQQIAIWIDFNQDYTFSSNELVFMTTQATREPINATFTLPSDAPAGATRRMRIRNQFYNPIGAAQACSTLSYGETEDYMVRIDGGCPPVPAITVSAATISCLESSTLTVTNCPGNVTWLPSGAGASLVVSPTQTTSYTAVCTHNSCATRQSATVTVRSATTSTKTGNWNDVTAWSCGSVPNNATTVTIRAGHVITLPASYVGSAKALQLLGQLRYSNNARLLLGPSGNNTGPQ